MHSVFLCRATVGDRRITPLLGGSSKQRVTVFLRLSPASFFWCFFVRSESKTSAAAFLITSVAAGFLRPLWCFAAVHGSYPCSTGRIGERAFRVPSSGPSSGTTQKRSRKSPTAGFRAQSGDRSLFSSLFTRAPLRQGGRSMLCVFDLCPVPRFSQLRFRSFLFCIV